MKKTACLIVGIFGSGVLSTALQAGPSREPNYEQVNGTIASALAEILPEYQSFLDHFNYAFDPQSTSLEKNEFFITAEGAIKETPWDPTKALSFSADFGFKIDLPPKNEAVEIFISKSLDTDGLEFIKYMTRKHVQCPVPDSVQGVMRVIKEQRCEILPSILAAESIGQLKTIYQNHIRSTSRILETYLATIDRQDRIIQGRYVKSLLQKERGDAELMLNGVKTARVESTKQGFLISARDLQINDRVLIKDVSVKIEANHALLSLTLRAPVGTDLYLAARPEIERVLQALEEGQLYAKELVKIKSRIWLNFIQRTLKEDDPSYQITQK
ncbi:MAG: hypothetical protein AB7T49_07595 [Oligoflexales bacterium]